MSPSQDVLDAFGKILMAGDVRIHPLAVVHETALLGRGTVVWSGAVVCAGVRTGLNCAIGSNVYIGRDAHLGESVRIQHGAFITNNTKLGNSVFIGPNVTFTDDRYPRVNNPHYHAEPPILEDNASIGAGAVLLPGVRIGHGAMVGAGAVVTHDVDPWDTVSCNPAQSHRRRQPLKESSII